MGGVHGPPWSQLPQELVGVGTDLDPSMIQREVDMRGVDLPRIGWQASRGRFSRRGLLTDGSRPASRYEALGSVVSPEASPDTVVRRNWPRANHDRGAVFLVVQLVSVGDGPRQ